MQTITVRRFDVIALTGLVAVASFAFGALVFTPAPVPPAPHKSASSVPTSEQPPDWTIARCSLWGTDAAPILPPFTIENVCYTEDGTLSYADQIQPQLATK